MFLHNALDEREAEPCPPRAAREERLEDSRTNLLAHAQSVIADLEAGVAVARGQEANLDRAAIREDLKRVHEKVQGNLINEFWVAKGHRVRVDGSTPDSDAPLAGLGINEVHRPKENLAERRRFGAHLARSSELEEGRDHPLNAVDLVPEEA